MGCKSQRGKGLGDIRTGSYGVHKIDKAARRSGIRNRGLGGDAGALIFDIVFDMVLEQNTLILAVDILIAASKFWLCCAVFDECC